MRNCYHRYILPLTLLLAFGTGKLAAQTVPLDALMRGARIHYAQGRFERALETFQQAMAEHGDEANPAARADIHIWLGLSQAQLRRFEPAATHFATAIALDTGTIERIRNDDQWSYWAWTSLFNSAREFYARGQPDSSLTYSLAAAQIDPARPGAYSLVANSYSALGRFDDMLATAREMLSADPKSSEAFSLVGLYFLQPPAEFWTGAMKDARWDSSAFYYGRAIELYESRYNDALKNLSSRLGIAEGPELDAIAANLIELSRATDQQVLKDYIEKDLKASRMLADIAQIASTLYLASGNLNVASSRAGSALLRASAETRGATADAFRARSEELFTIALRYDPFDFSAMYNLGIAQYQAQNDTLAEVTFRKAIEMTVVTLSDLPEAVRTELRSYVIREAAADGHIQLSGPTLAMVDEAIQALGNPVSGFAWFFFPELRTRKEFTAPGAAEEPGMYLSIHAPAVLENLYLLTGVTQTSIGLAMERTAKGSGREKLLQAISTLKTAHGIDPDNAEAWQNLIHAYRETGQEQKALEAAERYHKLSDGRR